MKTGFWTGAVVLAACLLVPIAPAAAQPDSGSAAESPQQSDFYRPPDPLPGGQAGDIIRTEPFQLALSVPNGGGQLPATAQRLMYRSNDTHDRPTADTGTYLEPEAPWRGPGERPLVVVAPGTYGQGSQCAPSKQFAQLIHYQFPLDFMLGYEVLTAYSLLAQGIAVVVPDYHGAGIEGGVHDYMNRKATGYAVLDAARAAQRLTGSTSRVGIFGFSQGGEAAAAGAELHGGYAPELDLVGTYAGGVPADLHEVLGGPAIAGVAPDVAGGFGPGLIGYVVNGVNADYPEARKEFDAALSPLGKQMLADSSHSCVPEMMARTMLRPNTSYIADGSTPTQAIDRSPVLRRLIEEQRLGSVAPDAPTLVAASRTDDVIPYDQVRRLAADWCAQGATVQFAPTDWLPPLFTSLALDHALQMPVGLTQALGWLNDRLAGTPAPGNCAAPPA